MKIPKVKKYLLSKNQKIEKKLFIPSRALFSVGNINKAKKTLNYRVKANLDQLVSIMTENDLKLEKNNY